MNLSDLANIDINDIDFSKIREKLLIRQDLVVNIGLIILSCFLMIYIYQDRKDERERLKNKIIALEQKSESIETYQAYQERLEEFMKKLPEEISSDTLISELTDIAVARNIQILSFTPAKQETRQYYDIIYVNLDVLADSYADIGLFIYDIENSIYDLRVERWSGHLGSQSRMYSSPRGGRFQASGQKTLTFSVKVALVNFKK